MTMTVIRRDGAWQLCTSRTAGGWVQWINAEAEGWRAEFLRVVRAARDAGGLGLDRALGPYVRDAYRALGQLCRACDLPVPACGPYARRLVALDAGPDPWLAMWGEVPVNGWRSASVRLVSTGEPHVAGASNVVMELAKRYWLDLAGNLSGIGTDGTAPNTSQGGDSSGWSCAVAGSSGPLHCVSWVAWWPGPLSASRDVYVSAAVPIAWQWELIAAVAEEIAAVDLEGFVAASRAWVLAKNISAAHALGLETPADILQAAAAELRAHETVDEDLQTVGEVGGTVAAAVAAANPLAGVLIALATGLPALLQSLFGRPVQYATDAWGRREPVLESPRLTGTVFEREQTAPTHEVLQAPSWSASSGGGFVLTTVEPAVTMILDRNNALAKKKASRAVPMIAAAVAAWKLFA